MEIKYYGYNMFLGNLKIMITEIILFAYTFIHTYNFFALMIFRAITFYDLFNVMVTKNKIFPNYLYNLY